MDQSQGRVGCCICRYRRQSVLEFGNLVDRNRHIPPKKRAVSVTLEEPLPLQQDCESVISAGIS
jgi:hypothetical protein